MASYPTPLVPRGGRRFLAAELLLDAPSKMQDTVRARARWGRARQLVISGQVQTSASKLKRAARSIIKRAPRSALAQMLSSSSNSRAAVLWRCVEQICMHVVSLAVR